MLDALSKHVVEAARHQSHVGGDRDLSGLECASRAATNVKALPHDMRLSLATDALEDFSSWLNTVAPVQ